MDYEKDSIVEVNKSNFILWNNAMEEPIVVDKVGSQIDVLPTLLNLFGIQYDSITTEDHPFYVNGEGFVSAANLCRYASLQRASG